MVRTNFCFEFSGLSTISDVIKVSCKLNHCLKNEKTVVEYYDGRNEGKNLPFFLSKS